MLSSILKMMTTCGGGVLFFFEQFFGEASVQRRYADMERPPRSLHHAELFVRTLARGRVRRARGWIDDIWININWECQSLDAELGRSAGLGRRSVPVIGSLQGPAAPGEKKKKLSLLCQPVRLPGRARCGRGWVRGRPPPPPPGSTRRLATGPASVGLWLGDGSDHRGREDVEGLIRSLQWLGEEGMKAPSVPPDWLGGHASTLVFARSVGPHVLCTGVPRSAAAGKGEQRNFSGLMRGIRRSPPSAPSSGQRSALPCRARLCR